MKQPSLDWDGLNEITSKWFSETLRELREKRANKSHRDDPFHVLAKYCLIVCAEYRDAAFDAFRQGRFHAGLNSLRPILEHAIHLWWCGSDKKGVSDRLGMWEKAAAKQHEKIATEWRDLKPRGSQEWQDRDRMVVSWQHELTLRKGVGKLPSIRKLAQALPANAAAPQAVAHFYPVYGVLCRSSHAPLLLDDVFEPRDGALMTRSSREMPWMAPMEAVYVPLALVSAVDVYFQWKRALLEEGFQQAKQILDLHYKRAAQDAARRAEKAP